MRKQVTNKQKPREKFPSLEKDSFDQSKSHISKKSERHHIDNIDNILGKLKSSKLANREKDMELLEAMGEEEKRDQELKNRNNLLALAETTKKFEKNKISVKEKKIRELLLKDEIDKIKEELKETDQQLSYLKDRKLKKKLKKKKLSKNQKKISDLIKQQDKDLKKYKNSYQNLLHRWEKAMLEDDSNFKPKLNKKKYKLNSNIIEKLQHDYLGDNTSSSKLRGSIYDSKIPQFKESGNEFVDKYMSKIGDIEEEKRATEPRQLSFSGVYGANNPTFGGSKFGQNFGNQSVIPRKKVFVSGRNGGKDYFTPKKKNGGRRGRSSRKYVEDALDEYKAGNSQFQRQLDQLRGSKYR